MHTRLIMLPRVRSSAHAGPGRVGGGATGAGGRAAFGQRALREVVVGKDELLAGKEGLLANQDGLIEAQREQLGNYAETVRLHADREQVQDQLVDSQGELIDRLTAENAELRRRLSMDSSNSSLPPSSDQIQAKPSNSG